MTSAASCGGSPQGAAPEGSLSTRRRKGLRLMLHARGPRERSQAPLATTPKRKHGHLFLIKLSKIGPSGVPAAAVAALAGCGWCCEVAVLQADLPFLLSFSRYPQSLTVGWNEGSQLRGGGACAVACLSVLQPSARSRVPCVFIYTLFCAPCQYQFLGLFQVAAAQGVASKKWSAAEAKKTRKRILPPRKWAARVARLPGAAISRPLQGRRHL
jgi:hypothetical protein